MHDFLKCIFDEGCVEIIIIPVSNHILQTKAEKNCHVQPWLVENGTYGH